MIILASDHAGFKLKEYLKQYFDKHKIEYIDAGALKYEPLDDYPDIIKKASKLVLNNSEYKGIFICGSGVGVCMVSNRHKGIRAVLAYDTITAEMSRKHNNANVLCLGQTRVSPSKSLKIIKTFLNTQFEGGRHLKRIEKF